MTIVRCRGLVAALLLALCSPGLVAADASLDEARSLYAAASFERALEVLRELESQGAASQEALEYKALCLIALGRAGEARTVVDQIVMRAPSYQPDADASPRFAALLNDARQRLLPEITRQLFNTAKDQYRARDTAAARKNFEEVLRLLGDAAWEDRTGADDLRTIASGFLELVNATTPPVVVTPSGAEPPTASAPATVATPVSPSLQKVVLQPPVAVEQVFPKWLTTGPVTTRRLLTGALRVRIDTDGRVVNAAIEVATDPRYDQQLLAAARSWRYVPAHRDGQPIEMDKLITYSLRTN